MSAVSRQELSCSEDVISISPSPLPSFFPLLLSLLTLSPLSSCLHLTSLPLYPPSLSPSLMSLGPGPTCLLFTASRTPHHAFCAAQPEQDQHGQEVMASGGFSWTWRIEEAHVFAASIATFSVMARVGSDTTWQKA